MPDRKVLSGVYDANRRTGQGSLGRTSPTVRPTQDKLAEKVENLGILAVQIRRSQQPRL